MAKRDEVENLPCILTYTRATSRIGLLDPSVQSSLEVCRRVDAAGSKDSMTLASILTSQAGVACRRKSICMGTWSEARLRRKPYGRQASVISSLCSSCHKFFPPPTTSRTGQRLVLPPLSLETIACACQTLFHPPFEPFPGCTLPTKPQPGSTFQYITS